MLPTAALSNGIWMRRFENGLVLVNPQVGSASIDIGSGYKRLSGSQDPKVNTGQAQRVVTLGARQGLLMIKVPQPCIEPAPVPASSSFATPKVAAIDWSRKLDDMRKALLARFDYVILGLGQSIPETTLHGFVAASSNSTRPRRSASTV